MVLRALPLEFSSDPGLGQIAGQFMFGPALLINPITKGRSDAAHALFLPTATG